MRKFAVRIAIDVIDDGEVNTKESAITTEDLPFDRYLSTFHTRHDAVAFATDLYGIGKHEMEQ
jgi:hypothetical protein